MKIVSNWIHQFADSKRGLEPNLSKEGDTVFVKQDEINKFTTRFSSALSRYFTTVYCVWQKHNTSHFQCQPSLPGMSTNNSECDDGDGRSETGELDTGGEAQVANKRSTRTCKQTQLFGVETPPGIIRTEIS